MGLPFEAPSGGYDDDSTSPGADRFTEDFMASGYDGYSHDVTSAGDYQDAIDDDAYEDDLDPDEIDESGFGPPDWYPDADGPSRM